MKHWNCSDTANVCRKCGFETFSLPVYKRHSKFCSVESSKDMSCGLLNGRIKEPIPSLAPKEFSENSSVIKSQSSGNKNLLYCKLCQFSCSFSSQLIGHIKKVHSTENKNHQTDLHSISKSDFLENQMNNGVDSIKLELYQEADESNTRKKIVLKKIKLEIPVKEGNPSTGFTKDSHIASGASSKMVVNTASANLNGDEEKSRKCPECGFVAKSAELMLTHKASHDSNVVYSCNECDYKTSVRKNFERHEWCHIVDSPFKCEFCSFSSNGENAIKRHMSTYHTFKNQPNDEGKMLPDESTGIPTNNSSKKAKVTPEHLTRSVKIETLKMKYAEEVISPNPTVGSTCSAFPVMKLETTSMPSSFTQGCSTTSSISDDSQDYVCPHCGLCYKVDALLEQHIKTTHHKFSIHINNLTKRPLIQHDQKQLKTLEVSQLKSKPEPSQDRKNSTIQKVKAKVEQRLEVRSEDAKKVFKCGHCNFSVNEFSKLKEHMENNACQTVLHKLLTNDSPNNVYTNMPFSSLDSKSSSSMRPETLSTTDYSSLEMTEEASKLLDLFSSNVREAEKHSLEQSPPLINNFTTEDPTKTNKTYIYCLLCVYRTLSTKVLRKHLVRDHSTLITSKKVLKEVIQKSVATSIARKSHDSRISAPRHEDDVAESKVFLRTDVRYEAENNPPLIQEKKSSRHTTESGRFMPFKCSECGKRSNWKHIIKKHVSDKHENAKLIILSNEEAENSYDKYQYQLTQRILPKVSHNRFNNSKYSAIYQKTNALDADNATNHVSRDVAFNGVPSQSEEGTSLVSYPSSDGASSERLGMSDLLKLKRFRCSVCIYRSNFRCDISRHLKKRHPDVVNCHYTVMTIQEASETLPNYKYNWPEAEALLASTYSSVRDENAETKPTFADLGKFDPSVERKINAIIPRVPFNSEEGKRCNICPFVTNKAELLRLHMAYHQPQKRNCYSCPHCPFYVNTPRLLQHHISLHEIDQHIKSVAAEKTATQQLNAYNLEFNYVKRNPKFICEDCPYNNNNRNEFWKHRKGHFERGIVPSDLKCQHCPYWAEDKRDWHLHGSLHGGMQRNIPRKMNDLAIGEFCRCDLADLKNYGDLACFKQLRCPCCTIRNPSVNYMRHHMLTHMAFTDAVRHKIFDRDFDEADETLGNLCTRLLNMNYSLAEECRREPRPNAEDDDTQMPVLEKVTEMTDDSLSSSLSISIRSAPTIFSMRLGDSRNSDMPYLRIERRQRPSEVPHEYKDEYVLSAPEEVVESGEELISCTELLLDNDVDSDGERDETSVIRRTERECPRSRTLFFLSLGVVPT